MPDFIHMARATLELSGARHEPRIDSCSKAHGNGASEMFNWDMVAGEMQVLQGKLLEEWGLLVSDERAALRGQHDQLIGNMRRWYGLRRSYVDENVSTWVKRLS